MRETKKEAIFRLFFVIWLFKQLVADALLGILIEYMDSGCVDCNLDLVAGASGRTRGNSCDNVLTVCSILHTLECEVEIDLCAHKLGNVNVNVEYGV